MTNRRLITTACVAALSVLATGCASIIGEVESPIAPELTANWSAAHVSDANQIDGNWWEAFQDPALNSLIDRAYAENYSLRIAASRILEARDLLGVSRSDLLPTLTGAASIGRTGQSANATPSDDRSTDYRVGIDTAWELDFWGRVQRGVDAANSDLNSLDAGFEDAALSIGAEVASFYVQYRVLEAQIALAEANVELQRSSLSVASTLREEGERTELDVQQARAILADTEALIPELNQQRLQTANGLATLLSTSSSDVQQMLSAGSGEIPAYQTAIGVGVPLDVLRRRPDVRQAEFAALAASARVGVAKADRLPRLSLNGELALSVADGATTLAGGGPGDLLDGDSVSFSIGPRLSIPLFNAGRLKNLQLAADARFDAAADAYGLSVLQAVQDVENALVSLSASQSRYDILSISVAAYQRAAEISQIQYQEGEANFQSVLDSQRQLVVQQQTQLTEQGDISLSQIALIRALGGGWSRPELALQTDGAPSGDQ